ncbi:MAG: hypothetical protein QG671_3810 [Actinomycetota bacterium]|nr:hypothetical protein [Actinomycetota bacterium]
MSSAASTTTDVASAPAKAPLPKRFGFSALLTGCAKMWHGVLPAMVFIVVNAIIQSVLTWWNPQSGLNAAFIISLIVSALSVLVAFAVVTRVSLDSISGHVTLGQANSGARRTLVHFSLWVLVQWLAITVGLMIFWPLGALIAALTAFLPLAAADGQANPIRANFSALKDRWGRWLITSLIISIGFVIWFLLMAVNVFFVKGFPASLLVWFVGGILGWWLLTAWAAIYRSTAVGAASDGDE